MRGEIRDAFVSIAILVVVVGAPQEAVRKPYTALENEFVTISVIPSQTPHKPILADCGSSTGHPFVRIFIPTRATGKTEDTSNVLDHRGISATYIEPERLFGCSGPSDGMFFDVDLKSVPARSTFKDDSVKFDAVHNEVLLENDRIRVVRIHFASDESGPMVDMRPRVVIAVTDSQATVTFPDGHSEPREMKAGSVTFGNAGKQATKNSGTTPLENIVVELKGR